MSGFNWQKYEVWRNHPMLNNNLRYAGWHPCWLPLLSHDLDAHSEGRQQVFKAVVAILYATASMLAIPSSV